MAKFTESTAERLLDGLAAMLEDRMTAKKAVSSTYSNYGHGPGLFTQPMQPDIINAMQLPLAGLQEKLPELPTDLELPLYGIITGQSAGTDVAVPADSCGAWGAAGYTLLCRQYAPLGTQGVTSQPIDLNRVGRFTDRADFRDYRLVGDPFSNSYAGNMIEPLPGQGGPNDFLNNELAKIMRETEVECVRRFAVDIWTANPGTAADAYHTAYYRGMQLQVNTNYQDAVTQTACSIVDSTIINFATASVAGNNISTIGAAGSFMVQLVADLVYTKHRQSVENGLDPIQYEFAGTPELFRELTAVWPCAYLTNRCQTSSAANPQFVDATEQVRMREEMRAGSFLWVDGKQIYFNQDPTLPQTQVTPGVFTSDLYYIPLTVRGNFPVLFRTYFNYNAPGAAGDAIKAMGPLLYGSSVSPNGKYLFSIDKSYDCVKVKATYRPGLVLRTPFQAARITNIAYQPRLITNSWNPNSPSFYFNGGVSTGTGPSYYKPTVNG